MANGKNILVTSFTLIWIHLYQIQSTGVPALLWSPSRSFINLPDVYVGHTIKHQDFETNYLDPITDAGHDLIVVFVQNKLNLEDFAHYADIYNIDGDGGAFKHVKSMLDEDFSLQLPAVDFPALSIEHLKQKFKDELMELNAPCDTSNLNLASKRLLIVHLPSVLVADERKSFIHNDEIIAKVLAAIKKKDVNYIALYTAESCHQGDDSVLRYSGRHLLASNASTQPVFVNASGCILLYANAVNVFVQSKHNKSAHSTIKMGGPVTFQASCRSNSTHTLSVEFDPHTINGTKLTKINLDFTFNMNAKMGDWFIDNATFIYSGFLPGDTKAQTDRVIQLNLGRSYTNVSAVWAPLGMSYHCTNPHIFTEKQQNDTSIDVTIKVSFDKLQLQPYDVRGHKFKVAYDCVYFFTGMIWTGIVSVAILLIILYFGLSMISGIKVMHKFDDPKGKPLILNAES